MPRSRPAAAKAEHFRVGAHREESPAEYRTLNYGARYRFQWIMSFGAQRCGAFESHETEKCQNQTQSQAAALHPSQWSWSESTWEPWRTSTSVTSVIIMNTETASIHSISRAEIFTSRHAIQTEAPVTSSDISTASTG